MTSNRPSARFRGLRSSPELFTMLRVALVPVLWILAILGHARLVGIGLAVAGLTDTIDGFLARRLRVASARGSRHDTLADHLLFASAIGWLILLRPEFIREQAPLLLSWLAIGVTSLIVGWLKFRRFADLHLYSAKAAAVLGIVFAVHTLIAEHYSEALFRIAITIAIIAATETLLVQLTHERVDEHIGSILTVLKRGRV